MRYLRNLTAALVAAGALATAGCYGETTVRATTPDLAYVGPDVQVVADYDYPTFYSGGYYYRYDNGVWLSSNYYDRGFIRARIVPRAVLGIDRPYAYVRYHHRHEMGNRRPVRVYRY